MWVLAASCAFIAGVALGATHNPAWLTVLCPAIASYLLLARRTPATVAVLILITLLFGVLGICRYERSLPCERIPLISQYNDSDSVTLYATVAQEPEYGGRYTQVVLDHILVEEYGSRTSVQGRVQVTTPDPRPLHYGDEILFRGYLRTPPILDGFDYQEYLARQGIYSTAFTGSLEAIPSDLTSVRARLLSLNRSMGTAIGSVLPEPEASLAQSILLGRRGGLSDSLSEAFIRTGTAHLLAISGLHLGILAAAILTILLAALGRRHYLYVWIALLALWTYAVFSGLRPPVVRAALMASTFLIAELAGRQKHGPTALALAAAIMAGVEPQLLWQASFQLSALAMGGLILLYRPIQAELSRLASHFQHLPAPGVAGGETARDIVAATLAATIAIWPVCAITFGQVSMLGIPVSVLTLPLLPFALGFSAVAGTVALVSTALATPFAWLAWLFLSAIITIIETFSALPWAVARIDMQHGWVITAYFAILCFVPFMWHRLRTRSRAEEPHRTRYRESAPHSRLRWAIPPLLLTAVLVWAAIASAPDGKLRVVVLDVGQGDAALVVSPAGRTVLIDGGIDGQQTGAIIDRHLPFWNRRIDIVVATHAHADHIGGLPHVVDRFRVGIVVESPYEHTSLLAEEWHRRLARANITRLTVTTGYEVLFSDGVHLQVLHPTVLPLLGTTDDTDNNGVVIRISYGEISFLFAADIMMEAERVLTHTQWAALDCDVLKVPHHGSSTSTTTQFLVAVDPAVAVISAGSDNPYGHPHDEVLERLGAYGVEVLTTAEHGSIEFITDGSELWLRTEKCDASPPVAPIP